MLLLIVNCVKIKRFKVACGSDEDDYNVDTAFVSDSGPCVNYSGCQITWAKFCKVIYLKFTQESTVFHRYTTV